MALIYRAILEIEDPDRSFVERASVHFRDWLRFKLEAPNLDLPVDSGQLECRGVDVQTRRGARDQCAVIRISAFEGSREDGAEVKTTLTAIQNDDQSWAWVDLERWASEQQSALWIPVAPGLVTKLVTTEQASRGGLSIQRDPVLASGAEGARVAELVRDQGRVIPLVVVSYNRDERKGVSVAEARGRELARRLAGVAMVYVLGERAVSAFSKEMHETVGDGMDVHTGAIRTFLPGVGTDSDFPGRHRFVSFRKLQGRRPELAALIITPSLLRRAVETPPPPIWRTSARALIVGEELVDYDELLRDADVELEKLNDRIESLEQQLTFEQDSVTDLARQVDDQGGRIRFLRTELSRIAPDSALEPDGDVFDPVFCSEVVEHAQVVLSRVEFHESVLDSALALDEHANESWARKAWLAFRALQEYADAKVADVFDGDFKSCCEKDATDVVVPASWVARTETKQTMSNRRYAELRDLPISTNVTPAGRIVMEAHIKLQPGGSPSPRIHFFDDTRGATGKVHVGWFGDHLDSRAKS